MSMFLLDSPAAWLLWFIVLAVAMYFARTPAHRAILSLTRALHHSARLAAHSLDATLLVVALPVGAAMMTYSLVRGGDLRTSGRMMALCGIGIGAMHSLAAAGGVGAVLPFLPFAV